MRPAEFTDYSLRALIVCWRRVLYVCPEVVDQAQRSLITAWEAEAARRGMEVTR